MFAHQDRLDQHILSILQQTPEGLSLFELIKALSTDEIGLFDSQSLKDSVTLFQTNFVVMNALYRLDKSFQKEHLQNLEPKNKEPQTNQTNTHEVFTHQKRIEIHALKVKLHCFEISNTPNNSTQITSENTLAFIKDQQALESYYLDWQNFDQSEEDVNELLNSFWERLVLEEHQPQDLKILNLTSPVTRAAIKQSYRKLSQQHHPDKGGDPEVFMEIQQAAERLLR
jgi:hypothetical protein